jgi:hypothetical protein
MTWQNGPWRSAAFPVNHLIIRVYLEFSREGDPACPVLRNRISGVFSEVKGLTRSLEDGVGELAVGDSHFTEQVQIGGHDDSGTKVNGRREAGLIRKVVGQ